MFHWMKEARSFAGRNRGALTRKPIWLFSSGPTEALDQQGRDRSRCPVEEVEELRECFIQRPSGLLQRVGSAEQAERSPNGT